MSDWTGMGDSTIQTTRISTGSATTIAARTCGQGEAVVLIPSWARGASDFEELTVALADAGYRAIAVNPRGIEGSEGPLDGITTWDMADDVAAVINRLGAGPAHVVGHAGGNRVARALATRHPGLVKSVALLAAGGKHNIREKFDLFANETMFAEPSRETFIRVMHQSGFFAATSDPSVWLDGWWRATAGPQALANRAVKPEEWWAGGGKPMLVVQGLEDGIAPPENGRDLRRLYPDRVNLVELERAGHAMLPEQPAAITEAIISWLKAEP